MLAARFAAHRGATGEQIAASAIAGALAEAGLIDTVVPADASAQTRVLLLADAPLRSAWIVAAIPGLPAGAADIVRWHREHDDGTGVPDRLRWDGIPADAAALGIAQAFLEALEDAEQPREPAEALFALAAESGRRFRVELIRTFRDFVLATPDWESAPFPALPAIDEDAMLAGLAAKIDARDPATGGRSERIAATAAALATRVGADPAATTRLARLTALERARPAAEEPEFDPLSRFARDHRAAAAEHAAAIAAAVPAYAADAGLLRACAAWHEDGAQDRSAAIVAVVAAADALPAADAPRRIAAAAGSQFDPEVARTYLAGLGAAT